MRLHEPTERQGRLSPLALTAAFAVAVLFYSFAPGVMSGDSLDQYGQGLAGKYNDAHPPLMSALLGLAGRTTGSPAPLLLLQLAALAGAFAALAARTCPRPSWLAPAALCLALALPSTWAIAVTLWKDVWVATLFLAATAALAYGRVSLSLLLVVIGTAFRHNALAGALPLAAGAVALHPGWSRRTRAIVLGLTMLAAGFAVPRAIRAVAKAEPVCMECALLAYDAAAIYLRSADARYQESVLAPLISLEDLRQTYSPDGLYAMFYEDMPGQRRLDLGQLAPLAPQLLREWASLVLAHPTKYLRHRFEFFRLLTSAHDQPVYYPYHVTMDDNPWGLRLWAKGPAASAVRKLRAPFRDTLLFRGWFWLAAAFAMAVAGLALRRFAAVAVATSALLYGLGYAIVGSSSDFRYFFWTVIGSLGATMLLAAPRDPPGLEGVSRGSQR